MKKYVLMTFFLAMLIRAYAQQDNPGLPGDDPDVPVDGGIALMLLAGAAYGAKKIKDAQRDTTNR